MRQAYVRRRVRLPALAGAVAVMAATLLPLPAIAQIGINLKTDRAKYFRYEPILAEVTLCNFTGNPLLFGEDDTAQGYLKLIVEDAQGMQLPMDDPKANPAVGLLLGAGETKSVKITLNNLFNLQKEGAYTIHAVIGHGRLTQDFRSDALTVSVTAGRVVWTRDFGLPSADPVKPIVSRKASLLLFPDKKHDLFALFIEDAQLVYGVARLGSRISGAAPQCDVDALSNIHVLLMIKPRLVEYRVYDCNLQLKQRRFYMIDGSTPMLQRDPDVGRGMVVGGRLAEEGKDYVPEDTKATEENTAPPARTTPPAAVPETPPATPSPPAT